MKATNYKRLVNDFDFMDEHFALGTIEADGETWYCAINYKYCDEHGKLAVGLNGLQMHLEKSLEATMNSVKMSVMLEKGCDFEKAFNTIYKQNNKGTETKHPFPIFFIMNI